MLRKDIFLIYYQNAFSTRLSEFGFNFFSMFVPDLLHEFELGVWKNMFKHLLRILYAAGGNAIQELNSRYAMECGWLLFNIQWYFQVSTGSNIWYDNYTTF
jgi:hypothetical protein